MRVLVCGSRDYKDSDAMARVLDRQHAETPFSVLIHGAYRGADTLADEWAKSRGIEALPFPADWKRYGGYAGPRRNDQMLKEGKPDLVIAFPGQQGTEDMVTRARLAKVPVLRVVE